MARPVSAENRIERLEKIAVEAAEQSGRLSIPDIRFADLCQTDFSQFDTRLVCSASPQRLCKRSGKNIIAAIGPEGGFSPGDLAFFENSGFERVSLGRLVLRSETAAVAAAACLLI